MDGWLEVIGVAAYISGWRRQELINQLPPFEKSMAKKVKQSKGKKSPEIRTFPIHKHKSFIHNLNAFLKMLGEHHLQLTSRQFLMEVHSFVTRYKEKHRQKDPAIEGTRHKIKICKHCDGWSRNAAMLQCTLCEDHYHEHCLGQKVSAFRETRLCQECDQEKMGTFDKEAYLSELIEDRCYHCGIERGNREAFVHCLRCAQQFHKKCYGKNVAVCGSCKTEIDEQLRHKKQTRQSTLEEWGCSSRKKAEPASPISERTLPCQELFRDEGGKEGDDSRTQPFREKDQFCYNYEPLAKEQLEGYKEGLMFAILAKKMSYTEELQPVECSLDTSNEESLDFGLDHMTRSEYEAYCHYKRQPIGPFCFVFKEGMGYDVVADRDIREKTLICEYVGEVVTLRKCIDLEAVCKNDSLMELRTGCNSDQTLILRPDRFTNMARFINGINNKRGGRRPNVGTVRKLARGVPTVVLYSIRGIRRGESLLYDYNAGATSCKYDTSEFL